MQERGEQQACQGAEDDAVDEAGAGRAEDKLNQIKMSILILYHQHLSIKLYL